MLKYLRSACGISSSSPYETVFLARPDRRDGVATTSVSLSVDDFFRLRTMVINSIFGLVSVMNSV